MSHINRRPRSCVPYIITSTTSPSLRRALNKAGFCADCGRNATDCRKHRSMATKQATDRFNAKRREHNKRQMYSEVVTR